MKRIILILAISLDLFASAPLLLPPPNKTVIDNQLALNKPDSSLNQMSLNEFVKYAAKSLNKNILVSGTLTGSIDFLSNTDLKNKDIMPLLSAALELNNYALVSSGAFLSVVPASDLSKYDSAYLGKRSAASFGSKVISIRYSNVLPILDAIKHLLSPAGSAFGVPDSGALVISDLPDNIKVISSLVSDIDKKPIPKASAFKSFHLVNSTASSVLETLKAIYKVGGQSDNRNDHNATSTFVSSPSFSSPLTLSINSESNTLLAMGDPALIEKLPSIIDDLDREQFQVYIQVRIIELNTDLSTQIGLKFGLDGGIVSSSDFFTFTSNMGGSSIAPIAPATITKLTASLGNIKQLLSIGAALDLLHSSGVSKTISDPSVLCLNNKESKIVVGKSISFLKGSTTGAAGTTNSLDRSDIGLNLSLKPLVASKDKLTLSIDAVLQNILPSLDSNNQPITSKQQITTDSILHHGETIVLGGFVKSYDTVVDDSPALLSDLPYIGSFFKHSSKATQQDNLLLVITPYIVDNSQTLSKLQTDLGILGQYQRIYNREISKK
jgi:general secretion pathway protein D